MVISSVLGSTEIDLLSVTNAYAMLASGGKKRYPILIRNIQDRYGKIIYRSNNTNCIGCEIEGELAPNLAFSDIYMTSPENAWQITKMLEEVVQNGTARRAKILGTDIAGKTGTTNNAYDSWFVGYSDNMVVGVYVGFDQPKSLGRKASGASIALPIFVDFMKLALKENPNSPFKRPKDMYETAIDSDTGLLALEENQDHKLWLSKHQIPTLAAEPGTRIPIINYQNKITLTVPSQSGIGEGTGGVY